MPGLHGGTRGGGQWYTGVDDGPRSSAMDDILTREEIEERYKDEWVLLGDHESDEFLRPTRGRVLCHSKDRDEVYRTGVELKPRHSATMYVGTCTGCTFSSRARLMPCLIHQAA